MRDRALSLCGFLALWWIAARWAGNPALLPSPERVLAFMARETMRGELPYQIGVTLLRVVAAFVIAMALGTVIGFAMGRLQRLNAWLDPWVTITLNLPMLVLVVLAYIWIGLNDAAAVAAVVAAKLPTVIVTMREGARALDPCLDDISRVFRLPIARKLRRIVAPQLAPYLAAAGRSGLSITWKLVLVVELLGRPDGVGFALNLYFQNFNVTGILAYGLAFAGLMLVVEAVLVQPAERRANAWRRDAEPGPEPRDA